MRVGDIFSYDTRYFCVVGLNGDVLETKNVVRRDNNWVFDNTLRDTVYFVYPINGALFIDYWDGSRGCGSDLVLDSIGYNAGAPTSPNFTATLRDNYRNYLGQHVVPTPVPWPIEVDFYDAPYRYTGPEIELNARSSLHVRDPRLDLVPIQFSISASIGEPERPIPECPFKVRDLVKGKTRRWKDLKAEVTKVTYNSHLAMWFMSVEVLGTKAVHQVECHNWESFGIPRSKFYVGSFSRSDVA